MENGHDLQKPSMYRRLVFRKSGKCYESKIEVLGSNPSGISGRINAKF
jgi:hypothetical protein